LPSTGKLFYRFHQSLNPDWKLPKGFSVINPFVNKEALRCLKLFCDRFYQTGDKRILVAGINPGRFGAGITGVPFTDPVALFTHCGIKNSFDQRAELSSTWIYEMIGAMGGPDHFYKSFLLSAVCPLGFLKGTKNANYYDDSKLFNSLRPFIVEALTAHAAMNLRRDVVISLGKKNADHLNELNQRLKLFDRIITLEHPRFIMQYRRRSSDEYIRKYIDTFSSLI
jgi:hypothetical protein